MSERDRNTADPHDLARFLNAQGSEYAGILAEIRRGRKVSHWMWYVFPQLQGLGSSAMSRRFAIRSLAEARAFLADPVLGSRLREAATALLGVENKSARDILGSPDDLKLRSSATLFAQVSTNDSVFHRILEKYFESCPDPETLRLLADQGAAWT